MHFYNYLLFATASHASMTYSNFQANSNNGQQCNLCTTIEDVNQYQINDCISKVPSTCLYQVTATVTSTADGDTSASWGNCTTSFGFGFNDFVNTIEGDANITAMTGKASLWLDVDAQSGNCVFDTYSTNNGTLHCRTTGDGTAIETITFTDAQGSIDLTKYKNTFVDLIPKTGNGSCGTMLRTVYYENGATATIAIRGLIQLTTSTSTNTRITTPAPEDGGRSLFGLSILLPTLLGSLYLA